jgi:response regulator RpfG family c-di-GMP phosphodiesterase
LEGRKAKILLADDDITARSTITTVLEMFGHIVKAVADGKEVVDIVNNSYDVIILDINMPGMGGFETIKVLNARHCNIPVLFLTGIGSMEYVVQAINLGGYDFLTKPIENLDIFNVKIRRAIEKRTFILREKNYKKSLELEVRDKTRELEESNRLLLTYSHSLENATVQLMSSLQNAMEEKDDYTVGHTLRVTEFAIMLGVAMNLSENDLVVLRRASQFHDIGKLVLTFPVFRNRGN